MTFAPYLNADINIQFHIAVAVLSLVIGPVALYAQPGSRGHKCVGYAWVTAMSLVALSSFTITSFGVVGPFSPIHLLAVWTLWSLYSAIRHVIAGRIDVHRIIMRNLYWYGLIIAGLFNFLPGRATNRLFFEQTPQLGYVVLGLGIALLVANSIRQKRARAQKPTFLLEKAASMV